MKLSATLLAVSLSFCAYAQREVYVEHNRLVDSAEYLSFGGKYHEVYRCMKRY